MCYIAVGSRSKKLRWKSGLTLSILNGRGFQSLKQEKISYFSVLPSYQNQLKGVKLDPSPIIFYPCPSLHYGFRKTLNKKVQKVIKTKSSQQCSVSTKHFWLDKTKQHVDSYLKSTQEHNCWNKLFIENIAKGTTDQALTTLTSNFG